MDNPNLKQLAQIFIKGSSNSVAGTGKNNCSELKLVSVTVSHPPLLGSRELWSVPRISIAVVYILSIKKAELNLIPVSMLNSSI